MNNFTLFYNQYDGKMHAGCAYEENEKLVISKYENDALEIGGYSGDGYTLTLDGFFFETCADIALVVPNGTSITLRSKNLLRVVASGEEPNTAVLYSMGDMSIGGSEEGRLECIAQMNGGKWGRAMCARNGNLSISGGTIIAQGGNAAKSGGIYAGGKLNCPEDKGWVYILGGVIFVSSAAGCKGNAVRANEGKLVVRGNEAVTIINAAETGNVIGEWSGESLTQVDASSPVFISFS